MRKYYILGVFFIVFTLTACSDKPADIMKEKVAQDSPTPGHRSEKQAEKIDYVKLAKRQTLPDYPLKTVGAAFDSYSHVVTNEWLVSEGDRGKIFIDYIGWLAEKKLEKTAPERGVSAQGVAVKFIIDETGVFGVVMISKVEKHKDNAISAYPIENLKGMLDKIYGDREIRF